MAIIDRVLEYVERSGDIGARAADVAVTLRIAEDHAATALSKLARRKKIVRAARGLYRARERTLTVRAPLERRLIVEWLRRDSTPETEPAAWEYAAAIERGEHMSGATKREAT